MQDERYLELLEKSIKTQSEMNANHLVTMEKMDRQNDRIILQNEKMDALNVGLEKLNTSLNNGVMGRVHERIDGLKASQVVNTILMAGLIAQLAWILFAQMPKICTGIDVLIKSLGA